VSLHFELKKEAVLLKFWMSHYSDKPS